MTYGTDISPGLSGPPDDEPNETPDELLASEQAQLDHLTDEADYWLRKVRADLAQYRVLMRSLEEQRGVVARMKEGM